MQECRNRRHCTASRRSSVSPHQNGDYTHKLLLKRLKDTIYKQRRFSYQKWTKKSSKIQLIHKIQSKSASCLPIFVNNEEVRVHPIQCNATVKCYCAIGNATNRNGLMTTHYIENKCEGGKWICSPPKDCCKLGCCYLNTSRSSPSNFQPGSVFNPLFLGHWYFWLAVTATVAGILCACSLWRKHTQGGLCCRDSGRDERASEPDSNGSCYAPPQYSRCNSFHQAPPPYSEVTSKPDLYPLVISYNAEPVKSNNSTGYLMVQYFRNFIVRPVGSLSATSTIDSLSSSFLCNAANEANTIIPPPYSHMGSLEEITTDSQLQTSQPISEQRHLPRSASTSSNTEYHQVLHSSPSIHTQISIPSLPPSTPAHQLPAPRQQHPVVSIRDNPCFGQNATNIVNTVSPAVPNGVENSKTVLGRLESKSQNNCDASAALSRVNRRIAKHKLSKDDSESQDEDHNFSDLLNLSVCMPSSVVQLENPIQSSPHLQELQYSVTNSIGSDISSLANLGSPDSPPRATSPTVEMKELLDKIQQLPQQKSPVPMVQQTEIKINRGYFHKVRAKTLYMPLYDSNIATKSKNKPNVFPRSWLSRSAPCTPCGNFVPNFPMYHHKGSQRGSKTKITDGSPLLREQVEESEDEPNKDECL